MRLKRDFFLQPTLKIAQDLLGSHLFRNYRGQVLAGEIIETEAYLGPKDLASHSRNWKISSRNYIEYSQGGFVYIYLVYGMYWQLNITTYKSGLPECVLLRALKPFKGLRLMEKMRRVKDNKRLADGPGKLCQALSLDGSFYGEDLTKSKRIWLEKNSFQRKKKIIKSARIGIDYAGPYWSKVKWRFFLEENK